MAVSIEVYRVAIGTFLPLKPPKIRVINKNHRSSTCKTLICLLILLLQNIPLMKNSYDTYEQRNANKISHMTFGNIKSKSVTILHWNKGNALFINKMDDILTIIERHKPKIMSILEANYINDSGIKIPEYSIEYTDMGVGYGTSRQVLLIHNSIQYTRRKNLEDKYLSIIVCKIKVNRNTHFNMIAHYRQWQLPQELKNNANQYNSQEYRY